VNRDGTNVDGRAVNGRVDPPVPGGRVVVGVDGSVTSRAALLWAVRAAAGRGGRVEVVTAFAVDFYWSDAHLLDSRRLDGIRDATERRVRELVDEVRRDPSLAESAGARDVDVEVVVTAGAAAQHLVDRSRGAALLVVGSRGRGAVAGALLGSVSLRCVTHAHCPVVVLHGPGPVGTASEGVVVVGIDGSPGARAALAVAAEEAGRTGARLEAVTAFRPIEMWGEAPSVVRVEDLLAGARDMATAEVSDVLGAADRPGRPQVDVSVVEGPAADVLLERAARAQLLVVGSRGQGTLPGLLLGSVALRVVSRSGCPVMVVHAAGERAEDSAPAETASVLADQIAG